MTERNRTIRPPGRMRLRQPLSITSDGRADSEDLKLAAVLRSWLLPLWKFRRQTATILTGFLVLGAIVSVLLPNIYTAKARVLPPENSRASLSGVLAALPEMAARMLPPSSDVMTVQLYPEIARSRTILKEVLAAPYGEGSFGTALAGDNPDALEEDLIADIHRMFKGSSHPRTQLVLFEVTGTDPELAAALLNQILTEMDKFFRYRVVTSENTQRRMIENRLIEVSDSLRTSEQRLMNFRDANRTTFLSPRLQLEEGRLRREVEINGTLYIELTKQLELARISEAESAPILNVLDYAVAPNRPVGPSRAILILGFLAFGFATLVMYLKFGALLPEQLRSRIDGLLRLSTQPTHG